MSEERAAKIKLIIFDVDGVMTDGTIFLFPAVAGPAAHSTQQQREHMADAGGFGIASSDVVEAKGFNAHDGTGFSLARLGGLKTAIITKRISETVRLRARDLKIEHVYQGQHHKLVAFREILAKENLTPEQICYVGDDVIDLPVMRVCRAGHRGEKFAGRGGAGVTLRNAPRRRTRRGARRHRVHPAGARIAGAGDCGVHRGEKLGCAGGFGKQEST